MGGCVLALLAIHPPTHPSIHITSCKYMEEHSNSSAFPIYEKPAGGEEHKRRGGIVKCCSRPLICSLVCLFVRSALWLVGFL